MLSEAREPLLDLDKCSLNELIAILENLLKIPLLMLIKLVLVPILLTMSLKKRFRGTIMRP